MTELIDGIRPDGQRGIKRAQALLRILMVLAAVMFAVFGIFWASAFAAERSAKAKQEFRNTHPCPSTGKKRGACPGYVVDHVKPLCAGGPDRPSNMQWQTIADGKKKDRVERQMCKRERSI